MKVLKPAGFKSSEWRLTVSCGCGAELYYVPSGGFGPRFDDEVKCAHTIRFRCPECGYETIISSHHVPSFVSSRLPSRDAWIAELERRERLSAKK